MKTWYRAVCDKCGEAVDIFVSNPSCTAVYLSEHDKEIQAWLEKHYDCELRLIWRDEQLDKLWAEGYEYQVDQDFKYLKRVLKHGNETSKS